MIAFIDGHRGTYGVEPMCRVLPIAPSTYHDHVAKRRDRARLSVRGQRDLVLKPGIKRVFAENFGVYGYRKVWRQMKREGFDAPRCTVERLMRDMGLQGVIRGKPVRTTVSDKTAPCPLGLVRSALSARSRGCVKTRLSCAVVGYFFVQVRFLPIISAGAQNHHARIALMSGLTPMMVMRRLIL